MKDADFSDLLLIRKGEKDLTLGGGDSALAPVVSIGEWEAKKAAYEFLKQHLFK